MLKRLVWRYTCEFCRKSGCGGGAMAKHEAHCTRNPNRVCGMCHRKAPLSELVEFAKSAKGSPSEIGNALQDEAGGCPACTLAAVLQSGRGGYDEDGVQAIEFDYKAAKDAWWRDANDEAYMRECY